MQRLALVGAGPLHLSKRSWEPMAMSLLLSCMEAFQGGKGRERQNWAGEEAFLGASLRGTLPRHPGLF